MNKLTSKKQEDVFVQACHKAWENDIDMPNIPSAALRKIYWLALTTLLDTLADIGDGVVASMPRGYGKFEVRKRKVSGVNLINGGVGARTAYRVHYAPGARTKWANSPHRESE